MSGSGWDGGVPPYQGTEAGSTGTRTYGGLGKRFGARLLDSIVVAVPVAVVLAVVSGLTLNSVFGSVVSTLVGFGYFVVMETSRGATLGKQLLGLVVQDDVGRTPISTAASMKRNAWMLLGVLNGIPVIGWLASLLSLGIVIAIAVTIANDDRNQGVHDQLARTFVVDRP